MADEYCVIVYDNEGGEPWYRIRSGQFCPIKYIEWTDKYTNLDYQPREAQESYLSTIFTHSGYYIMTADEFEIIWVMYR